MAQVPADAEGKFAARVPRNVIYSIRRKFNQETVHRDPELAKDAEDNMRTIAGQAQLLSTELYSKPTHFLLELVQNADDCSYAATSEPRLLLILFGDGLLYASNETGFEEPNVRAICDMAKSTKNRRVGAFTGEKGIGFKATAVVSECTYISSNGFDFCFDMRPTAYPVEALGLVCPRWEDNLAANIESWVRQRAAGILPEDLLSAFGTRIWLQLKPECNVERMVHQLQALNPLMLLNLRKLRHMDVFIVRPGATCQRSFSRSDQAAAGSRLCIRVQDGPVGGKAQLTEHHMVCLKHAMKVPEGVAATEQKRAGVDEVEFMFALPVTENGSAAPDTDALLFAFLPVRPYGFRFPIQADFVLPSNREGILEDRRWNQWMRDQLAPVFVQQAMAALQAHQRQRLGSSADPCISSSMLLQYIPLPGEVQDEFLGATAAAMLQLLQQQHCVLTASGKLALPASTLLPEQLLLRSTGQPLISNNWLQQGLPGLEYVHPDLLADSCSDERGSRSKHAAGVLRHLGSQVFDADMLVSWLLAAGTRQLLQQLPGCERTMWLKDLYRCLNTLMDQPANSSTSLADTASWGPKLAAAPILQLFGSHSLVSKAAAGQQLYLWDDALGGEQDVKLFSADSSSTSSTTAGQGHLQFVDPVSLNREGLAVVQCLLGINKVKIALLVADMLQTQATWEFDHQSHLQQVLFFFKHRSLLQKGVIAAEESPEQQLSQQLSLRIASDDGEIYTAIADLFTPLQFCHNGIPASLSEDLSAAGVDFPHPQYITCSQHMGESEISELCSWFKRLGMTDSTPTDAALRLLELYDECKDSITWQRHMQHIRFIAAVYYDNAASQDAKAELLKKLHSSLYLYHWEQEVGDSAPATSASKLFLPLTGSCADAALAAGIEQQLKAAGVQFIHTCYHQDVGTAAPAVQAMLLEAGVQPTGPDMVLRQLLQFHKNSRHLECVAAAVDKTVHEVLLQQLQYLAGARGRLEATQQSHTRSLCQHFRLHNSNGQLVMANTLHLPPQDAAAVDLLSDLRQAGGGLQVLAADYAAFIQDEEQRFVLTKLLGVQQADTAAVICAIVQLHHSRSAQLSQDQRLRHLAYLARHKSVLEEDQTLLQLVQQAVLLPSSTGRHYRGSQLCFPLAEQFAALQDDMNAADMLFLDSQLLVHSMEQNELRSQRIVSLLELLGVSCADESKVMQHVLKLYAAAERVHSAQHLLHLSIIRANWHHMSTQVQDLVRTSLKLRVLAPVARKSSSDPADIDSKCSRGSCRNSDASSISQRDQGDSEGMHWAAASQVYQRPKSEPEAQLVMVMQQAGVQFLHPMFESVDDDGRLLDWMRNNLGLKPVTSSVVASAILVAGEQDSFQYTRLHTWPQLVDHAVYLAGMSDQMGAGFWKRVKQALPIGLEPALGSTSITIRPLSAAGARVYWPNSGHDWQLQQVLLPSEVTYLHPAYAERVRELESKADTRSQARKLRIFFTAKLGVLDKPAAGSPELQHAICSGERWLHLLQLLAEQWPNYSNEEHKQLLQQLCNMQVVTSCGTSTLSKCFLPITQYPSFEKLLLELGAPLLDLPDPSHAHWSFLEQCGVSRSLSWQSLHKVLQQLSGAKANPPLKSMQELYAFIEGMCMIAPHDADKVAAAFAAQRLIFVPASGCSESAGHQWLTSRQILWSGDPRIFVKLAFLQDSYEDQEAFFHQWLHVRKAGLDDMKEALLQFSQSLEVTQVVIEATRLMYDTFAETARQQSISWLSDLMSRHPVLLVQDGGNCRFASAISGVYIPDNKRLVEMFSGDCCMLHVAPEAVPALRPLLQCIQPQLPQLSASVKRTCKAAADGGTVRQRDTHLTELVHSALPLAARYLYHLQPSRYVQLLHDGTLKQLWDNMPVYNMPGLVETLELDGIQKQQSAVAAVQHALEGESEQATGVALLVDSSYVQTRLLRQMADRCAEVLSGGSSSSNELLSDKVCMLLRDLQEGNSDDAETVLEDQGVSQIPGQWHFWSVPGDISTNSSGRAAQAALSDESAARSTWEDDSDERGIMERGGPIVAPTSHPKHLQDLAASLGDLSISRNQEANSAEAEDAESVASDAAVSAATTFAVGSRCDDDHEDVGADSGADDFSPGWSRRSPAGRKQHQRSHHMGGSSLESTYHQQLQFQQASGHSHAVVISQSGANNSTDKDMLGESVPVQDLQRGIEQMQAAAVVASKAGDVHQLFSGTGQMPASIIGAATVRGGQTALWSLLNEAAQGARDPTATTTNSVGSAVATSSSRPAETAGMLASDATRFSCANSFTATRQVTHTLSLSTRVTDTLVSSCAGVAASSSGINGPHFVFGQTVNSADSARLAPQQVTGALGECFLFTLFKETLPDFDEHCWKSGNRTHAGLPAPDSEPPFDFLYEDVAGKLTGVPGTRCVIDSKATSGSAVVDGQLRPIPITTREWHLAQMLHHEKSAVYIIVRVECVRFGVQPRVAAVLVDPVKLMHEGSLGVTGQELQLISGPSQ